MRVVLEVVPLLVWAYRPPLLVLNIAHGALFVSTAKPTCSNESLLNVATVSRVRAGPYKALGSTSVPSTASRPPLTVAVAPLAQGVLTHPDGNDGPEVSDKLIAGVKLTWPPVPPGTLETNVLAPVVPAL